MAENCAKCVRSLKNVKAKVSCKDCQGIFHGKCVNLSAEDVSFLAAEGEVWRCDPCSKTRRKSMVLESKSEISYDDVFKMFSELKEDFKRVEQNLGSSLNSCHEELAETKATLVKQSEELAAFLLSMEQVKAENASLRKQVTVLESRLDEAEQYSRRNCVEIHGIPMEREENISTLVKAVGRALDHPIEEHMVDACHRLRAREGSGRHPGIIVKLVRRADAEALLQKRRVKRNLNTHDLGLTSRPAEAVYVNESLTQARRKLLNAARQAKKEKSYTFLWIRGGRILMRKSQGDRVKVVTTLDDLTAL